MIEFPALGYCPLPGINRSESLARFEGFELNPRTGELRKNGDALVRLSQQPLRILLALLETPGELVAREDLRKRLWPNDTVVEFEHSINAAIKRLRQALGDSAENPVFIETLARRGYRWKTPVQWMEPAVESSTGAIGPTWTLTGQRVSHYRVLELLGGGGMGLVYKAEDLKLGRRVALKFLPAELVRDPVSLERFRREARAASVPDHPNICTIYEVGEYEGAPFIAMQLLRGQALNERIQVASHRPIGFDEILRVGIQVADGLEAAHREGIIHRDIKPANIFITERGEAKILDFGLAKLMDVDDRNRIAHEVLDFELGSSNLSLTHIGAAVGTASYMSPEQIRGQKLDARSDLFSLGLVLYEMSTGKRAFSGDSSTDVHNAVLHSVPASVRSLNSELPSEFQVLIEKSLSKDRESRYQSASELRSELERLRQKFGSRHYPQSAQMVRRVRPILYIGLLALLFFVLFRVFRGGTVPSVADLKLTQLTWNSGELPVRTAAISPDGRYLAYTDLNGIHVKILSTNETRTVPQPDSLRGSSRVDWAVIGWFPDGTRFVAQIAAFGEGCIDCDPFSTWVVSTLGDAPRKIHDQSAAEAVSPDGSLIAYTAVLGKPGGREIWVMDGAGGHSRKLFETDQNSWFRYVNWSPDGQRLAYIHVREAPGQNSTFESRSLNGGPPLPILTNINADALQDFVWLPDGNIVYGLGESRGNGCNYWKLRVDTRTGRSEGQPQKITHWGGFCLDAPTVTADGKRLAFTEPVEHGVINVARLNIGGSSISNSKRLALIEASNQLSGWTSDSHGVVFASNRDGNWGFYEQALDSDIATPILSGLKDIWPPGSVTPDGKWLLYISGMEEAEESGHVALFRVPLASGPAEKVLSGQLWGVRCARLPSDRCVLKERSSDHRQVIFSELHYINGRGPELLRMDVKDDSNWDLAPDGRQLVLFGVEGPIRIVNFADHRIRKVIPRHWKSMDYVTWANDSNGLYGSSPTQQGDTLLHINLHGDAHVLSQGRGSFDTSAIPSPDGQHIAIQDWNLNSNVWMMENF